VRIADLPRHHSWSQFGAPERDGVGQYTSAALVFDTELLAAQYALSGQGIALCDTNLFADEIRAGTWSSPRCGLG